MDCIPTGNSILVFFFTLSIASHAIFILITLYLILEHDKNALNSHLKTEYINLNLVKHSSPKRNSALLITVCLCRSA